MKTSPSKAAKKSLRKRHQMIVFVDGEKNYYAVSRATLERSRIDERRKKQIVQGLHDKPCEFRYINRATIPGSIVATPFEGGRQLHYAGYIVTSAKPKR
jgi:hypothetical protein